MINAENVPLWQASPKKILDILFRKLDTGASEKNKMQVSFLQRLVVGKHSNYWQNKYSSSTELRENVYSCHFEN